MVNSINTDEEGQDIEVKVYERQVEIYYSEKVPRKSEDLSDFEPSVLVSTKEAKKSNILEVK